MERGPYTSEERRSHALNELASLAMHHIEVSPKLGLLVPNPEIYPAQDIDNFELIGSPGRAAMVEAIATLADPRFPSMMEKLQDQEDNGQEITRVGELLKGGNNVVLATNHGELIDVALALAGVYSMLDKQNYHPKTGIMISKMVAMLEYRLGNDSAPAAEVLKILCNDIFLSFPRTESMRKSGLGRFVSDEVDKNNRKIRRTITNRFHDGGMLLAMAASGSTDKPDRDDPDLITMEAISHGTKEIMSSPKTYVLPMAVWLKGNEPVFDLCDIPRVVQKSEEADNVMLKIANRLNSKVLDKEFAYPAA